MDTGNDDNPQEQVEAGAGGATPSDTPHARDPVTDARKQAFLENYGRIGNVRHAALATGIHRSTHYEWLKTDPEYATGFKDAEEEYVDSIREELRLRAIVGSQVEVYNKGQFVGFRTEKSDRLLEVLAKGKCPELREKQEISGPNGGPIPVDATVSGPLRVVFVKADANGDSGTSSDPSASG